MQGKYKSLATNTIIFAIGSLGSKLITFFLVPLYTNYLTKPEYGTADLVTNISSLIIPVVSLVIQDAVLRFGLSTKYKREEVIKNAFVVFILGSLATISLFPLLGLYPAIREWRGYIIATSITNNACNILFSYSKAKEKNKLFSFSGIVQTFVLASLNILLIVFMKVGVSGYLLSNIIAHAVTVCILLLGSGAIGEITRAKTNKLLLIDMLAYSIPLIANNLSWWVLNSSDKVMIETFIDASDLGLYTAASKIPNLLSVVVAVFSSAWTVSSIKEYEDEKDKLFYSNVFEFFCLIIFFGGSVLLAITKPFAHVYIGSEFFSGWICTPSLIIGTIFFSISSFFGAIYSAVKKNIPTTVSTIIAATINILINWIFISRIGILAAAVSTAISYFVIGIIRMLHSRKYFKFKISFGRIILSSLVVVLQALLITIEWHTYLISAICVLLMAVIYIPVFKRISDLPQMLKNAKKQRDKERIVKEIDDEKN